tara:strand:+ start:63 stop:449 length:387 start_codon:yes stop_codon:yes gene_type:complete
MAKHKRFSDNNKSNNSAQTDEKTHSPKISVPKIPTTPLSITHFVTKYLYLIIAASLLSGVFTPITLGYDLEFVVAGVLTIFLGLAGAVVIFKSIKNESISTAMMCAGLGMLIASFILMFEVAEQSLFF